MWRVNQIVEVLLKYRTEEAKVKVRITGVKELFIHGNIISSDNESLIPNGINVTIPYNACVLIESKTSATEISTIYGVISGISMLGVPSMVELTDKNNRKTEYWVTFNEPDSATIEDVNDPAKQQLVKIHKDDIIYFLSGSKIGQPVRFIYERNVSSSYNT